MVHEVGGEQRLGDLTGRTEIARAGRKREIEGNLEEIVGGAKAATADAAEHLQAAGERISRTLRGEPKEGNNHER